jgi:hypothetical protein
MGVLVVHIRPIIVPKPSQVGDFNVGAAFPCVVDLKCSPSEALMVAASSTGALSPRAVGKLVVVYSASAGFR